MKNITLSVDDATYRHARIVAAQRGTSLSALVRDFLQDLREKDEHRTASWKEFWDELDAAGAAVGERPSRERTYDEPRFP